jgi:hypothetical protein
VPRNGQLDCGTKFIFQTSFSLYVYPERPSALGFDPDVGLTADGSLS